MAFERCECGKAIFRSHTHARAHASRWHGERMRVYRCRFNHLHVTNNEKSKGKLKLKRTATIRRRDSRRSRAKSRQDCMRWDV